METKCAHDNDEAFNLPPTQDRIEEIEHEEPVEKKPIVPVSELDSYLNDMEI